MSLLLARFPQLRRRLPHVPLRPGFSQVRRVPGLPGEVWVKDDGPVGTVYGGNKVRKLEWALADAQAKGCSWVLTAGALATNHGLATALYGRELGLRTAIVLIDQPLDEHAARGYARLQASGAALYRAHTPRRAMALAPYVYLRHTGPRPPYFLSVGGSSPRGMLGFVEAGLELGEQVAAGELPEPAEVVLPVGSGGCAAGLMLGLRLAGLRTRVHGVLVNDATPVEATTVLQLAERTRRLLQRRGAFLPPAVHHDLVLDRRFLGGGYGHATPEGAAAAAALAEEGVASEPVYTAKAAAALLELAPRTDGPVLYWQTHNTLPLDLPVA
jgi:D-cysteine desulfhydrase